MSSKWENRCESFERVPGSSGPWMMVCSLPFPLGGGPCMWIASLFFYFHMVWIWFNSASSSSMRLKSIIGYLTALQAMRPLLNSSVIPRRWEGERPTNLSPLLWWRQLSAARWASVSSAWKEAPGGSTIAWRDTLDREEDSGPWGERHPWANPLPSTATHPALQHGTEESALDSASTKTWVWALSSVPASVSSSVKRSWWYIPSLLQRVPGGSKKGRQWFCCHSGVRACDPSLLASAGWLSHKVPFWCLLYPSRLPDAGNSPGSRSPCLYRGFPYFQFTTQPLNTPSTPQPGCLSNIQMWFLSHKHTPVWNLPAAPRALRLQFRPLWLGSCLPHRSHHPSLSHPQIPYSSQSKMFAGPSVLCVLAWRHVTMHAEPCLNTRPASTPGNLAHPSHPSRLSPESPAIGGPHWALNRSQLPPLNTALPPLDRNDKRVSSLRGGPHRCHFFVCLVLDGSKAQNKEMFEECRKKSLQPMSVQSFFLVCQALCTGAWASNNKQL